MNDISAKHKILYIKQAKEYFNSTAMHNALFQQKYIKRFTGYTEKSNYGHTKLN
jgi:hypothetical protein